MSERIDNLIPLHAQPGQHELAGWEPVPAERDFGVHVLADVQIPMTDGTLLGCDVYVPTVPGCYPVIVSFSSYNFDLDTSAAPTGTNEIGSPSVMVPRGSC